MFRGALLVVVIIREDNLLHKPVPHNVTLGEPVHRDIVDPLKYLHRLGKPGTRPSRKVRLCQIAFELNPRRVRNIFICSGVVFCASSRIMNESSRVRPRI